MGALRQMHTPLWTNATRTKYMQAESRVTAAEMTLLSTTVSCTSASCFYSPIGTDAFHCLSLATQFIRFVCLLAVICSYLWIFKKWVHPLLSVYITTGAVEPDPGRGLWSLRSTGKCYFCIAYLSLMAAISSTDSGILPFLCLPCYRAVSQSYFVFLTFRCWSKLDPCVSHLSLFLNWSEKDSESQ